MRSRLEGVVGWEFIDSFGSVDELRDGRRCSKVSDPLRRHDLLDGMLVLSAFSNFTLIGRTTQGPTKVLGLVMPPFSPRT